MEGVPGYFVYTDLFDDVSFFPEFKFLAFSYDACLIHLWLLRFYSIT